MRLDESEIICNVIGCGYVRDSLAKKNNLKSPELPCIKTL